MPITLRHVPRLEAGAVVASLVCSGVLLIVKFVAYSLTGSAAVLSDALEGIVNVVAAAFALYSLYLAHQPADSNHPYGHGKIEFMSAGVEGGMVVLAAVLIVARAVEAFIRGPVIQSVDLGLILMAIAGFLNGTLGLGLMRIGRARKALILEADGKHLMTDAVTSIVAILALAVVKWTKWSYADPIAALLIAAYIVRTGVGLIRQSTSGLMDAQDDADDRLLRRILDSHLPSGGKEPGICSYHKLRHRHSGRYHWVDFHIMIPSGMSVEKGHHIASAIEYEIEQALGEGNATAHVEPCADGECAKCVAKS